MNELYLFQLASIFKPHVVFISFLPKDEVDSFVYFYSHHKIGEAFSTHTGSV